MSRREMRIIDAETDESWRRERIRLVECLKNIDFEKLLGKEPYEFLNNFALSKGTSFFMLTSSAIISTAYILQSNGCYIKYLSDEQPINLYLMMIAPRTTGKSSAFNAGCSQPLSNAKLDASLVSNPTPSGLTKQLASTNKAFIASPDGYDVLRVFLADDEVNNTSCTQLLCKLFSGEKVKYVYGTEGHREIGPRASFSILAAVQVVYAAKLLVRMTSGSGLLDRWLIAFPECNLPYPGEQRQALAALSKESIKCLGPVFTKIRNSLEEVNTFTFCPEAEKYLDEIRTNFVEEVNSSLLATDTPETISKIMELGPRYAVALHSLKWALNGLLSDGQEDQENTSTKLPFVIGEHALKDALEIVRALENQKQGFKEFVNQVILQASPQKSTITPSDADIRNQIMRIPGKFVNKRLFQVNSPKKFRMVTPDHFEKIVVKMDPQYGTARSIKSGRQVMTLFIKKKPNNNANPADVTQDDFNVQYHKTLIYTANNVGKRCLAAIEELEEEENDCTNSKD